MALPATDNFNRSNELLAANPNWANMGMGANLEIFSNEVRIDDALANCGDYWSADTPDADMYAKFEIEAIVGGDYPSILARVELSPVDFVCLTCNIDDNWLIEWYNSGAWTQIGSTYAVAPQADDIGKIEVEGSACRGFVNDVQRISGSNGGIPSSGYGGLFIYGDTDTHVDNFEVGNLAAAADALAAIIGKIRKARLQQILVR